MFLNYENLCIFAENFTPMKVTPPLQKQLNVKPFRSNLDKSIPQGFLTFVEFSKMLDDKITAHYEKLPNSYCSKSI